MIKLELVTLQGVKLSQEVHEVIIPTMSGQIGVLDNHEPLLSVAIPGEVLIRQKPGQNDDSLNSYAISGGVIDIKENLVRILVDEAVNSDEINESEAKKAYECARKLKSEAKDPVSIQKAQEMMDLSSVRINVAGLRRRKR